MAVDHEIYLSLIYLDINFGLPAVKITRSPASGGVSVTSGGGGGAPRPSPPVAARVAPVTGRAAARPPPGHRLSRSLAAPRRYPAPRSGDESLGTRATLALFIILLASLITRWVVFSVTLDQIFFFF